MTYKGPWARLWREVTAAPEFYRERRGQPLEMALAVAEPALSVALVTTLVSGIAAFIGALAPAVRLSGLPAIAAVTALLAYFYGRRLQWSGVIVREWVVLLAPVVVAWRIVTLPAQGPSVAATLSRWLADPISVLDAAFSLGTALLLLAWTEGYFYGRHLAALHPATQAAPARPEPGSPEYWRADEDHRALYLPPPTAIVSRWLQGGIVLALVSALGALGVRDVSSTAALLRLVTFGAPDQATALPNVLVYMLCGLVLVGLAQLSRLRANWLSDGVTVMPGLSRRALAALAAVTLAALGAALLLPTRYALGLGELLAALVYVLNVIVAFILALLIAPLALLLDRLMGQGHAPATRGPARTPLHAPALQHGVGMWGVVQSALFWGVALAVLAYCFTMLWRRARLPVPQRAALRRLARLAMAPLLWLLRVLSGALRRGLAGAATLARRLAPARQGRGPATRLQHPSWRNAGPRERVAFLYLSVEERARRLGLPRRGGQTATEYSRRLGAELPDLDPELSGLTDLFLEARYSPHAFDDARAAGARGLWKRVRARLRARRPGRR